MIKLTPFLFCLALATPLMTHADAPVCSGIFSAPEQIALSPAGVKLYSQLSLMPLSIFSTPDGKLNWTVFNELEKAKPWVAEYAQYVQTLTAEQKAREALAFSQAISGNEALRNFFAALQNPTTNKYQPTDYDLRRQFVSRVVELLHTLPPDFYPRIGKMKYDTRFVNLNKDAVHLVQDLDKHFDEWFTKTEGKTYEQWEKEIRASQDPMIQKAIALLDQDQMQIVMRRPENGRFWIPKVGFQNQFVSGSSKGFLGKQGRYNAEASMLGMTQEQYHPLDDELKPKYGTMAIKQGNEIVSNLSKSSQYGPDIYYFKKEMIQDRLTYAIGDSLNYLGGINRAWMSQVVELPNWHGHLIPWSHRLLMVPFMVAEISVNAHTAPSLMPAAGSGITWTQGRNTSYWESEIFGHVDLDMVSTFVFQGNVPSGEFLKELQKRHIQILDGRRTLATEWTEGMP